MDVNVYSDEQLSELPPQQLDSLLELVRMAWDPHVTAESYFASRSRFFEGNPYAREFGFPIALLTDGDRVIGHDSGIPCAVWSNGKEFPAYYRAGLFLHPDCRGKKLGPLLPNRMNDVLETKIAVFVVPQQLKTHKKLNWNLPGKLPEFLKILKPGSFFRKLDISKVRQFPDGIKRLFSSKNRILRAVRSSVPGVFAWVHRTACHSLRPRGKVYDHFSWVTDFDSRLDDLWDKVKPQLQCAQVRKAAYLNWHFPASKGWRKLVVEKNDKMVAFAIVFDKSFSGEERLSGLTVTSLIDVFYDLEQPLALQAIIDIVEEDEITRQSDVMLAATTNRAAQRLLKRNAFLPIPKTVYFTCHSSNPEVQFADTMDKWYLTRGEVDAYGALGPTPNV